MKLARQRLRDITGSDPQSNQSEGRLRLLAPIITEGRNNFQGLPKRVEVKTYDGEYSD